MNGQLELQLVEADLLIAYRAHYPLYPRNGPVVALFVLVSGIAIALLSGATDLKHIAAIAGVMLLWAVLLFLLLQLIVRGWWLPRFTRRIYAQQADVRSPYTLSWNDERIRIANENSTGSYAWHEFHKWTRTAEILLIYRSEALFHVVPLHNEEARQAAGSIVALLQKAGITQRKPA